MVNRCTISDSYQVHNARVYLRDSRLSQLYLLFVSIQIFELWLLQIQWNCKYITKIIQIIVNANAESLCRFQQMMPQLLPCIAALAMASIVLLTSQAMGSDKQIIFSVLVFGAGLAASLTFLMTQSSATLSVFWTAFTELDDITKFAISVVVICSSYFGGAMYLATPENRSGSAGLATPASCDTITNFEIPENLPEDDNLFFEGFLDKYAIHCIISLE